MSTARDRIAAAAEQHGWTAPLNTDLVSNVRIYTQDARTIIISYTQAGTVKSATRMFRGVSDPPRKDMPKEDLTNRDSGKVDTVLGWLAEPA